MKQPKRSVARVAGLLALLATAGRAAAEDIPPSVMRDWQFYNNTGWVYLNRGKLQDAEARFRTAIERIRPYSKEDQRLLARSYSDYARVLFHQGRHDQAEPLAKWALSVREAHPGVKPEAVYDNLYVLASIYHAQKRYAEAEPLLRRALAIQTKELGADHVSTAVTLDDLAGILAPQGKHDEAEKDYRRALSLRDRAQPSGSPETADTAEHLAVLLRKLNRTSEAETLEERVRTIRDTAATRAARAQLDRPDRRYRGGLTEQSGQGR
jgi:tetratricopeptide (TPR) repeat protein